MEKLRVLVIDDHPLMVAGVRGALAGERDIEIVGEASSGAQVLPLVQHTHPDLVLLDLRSCTQPVTSARSTTPAEWPRCAWPALPSSLPARNPTDAAPPASGSSGSATPARSFRLRPLPAP